MRETNTPRKKHLQATDLHGVGKLAIDATIGLTKLVETMHHNILRVPGVFGKGTEDPTSGITGLVYRSIRGATSAVGEGLDLLLGQLAGLLKQEASSDAREAVVAALNGVLGDHLVASQNPLAMSMQFRHNGELLTLTKSGLRNAIPQPGARILLLIHGLCMSDVQWLRNGHDHGAAVAVERAISPAFTTVYLRYNSGLHISVNGRMLDTQLAALLKSWPVPVEDLTIIAHSMGGLVTRSACDIALHARHAWLRVLKKIIFLGTPHFGAPLERGGNWIDIVLDASPYTMAFSRLGKIRSAGITDLRHAGVSDTDWEQRDRFAPSTQTKPAKAHDVPLPAGVQCYAVAASIGKKSGSIAGQILGDGLVPVESALGRHQDPAHDLAIPKARQWIGYEMNHMDLLDRQDVYRRIKKWLADKP
jgi:pimeloyl-ACP methyl ester carboxylesterase